MALELEEGTAAPNHVPTPARSTPSKGVLTLVQAAVLAMLFAAPAFMCLHTVDMSDCDTWWHLRTGEWIASHHAVPHVEPFSALAGAPYVAYSWLYEFLIYRLFLSFGLVGFVVYTSALILLITAAVYCLTHRHQLPLPRAVMLTFACMFSMGHLFTPRPWLFTILLFVSELGILMYARDTGTRRYLLWLPLIFALWANVHIQFVYGLFVLGLVLLESILARRFPGIPAKLAPAPVAAALVASAAATLINPYGWRIYAVAHDLATQSGALNKITELQALPFRDLPSYIVLLLAMASVAVLAVDRRLLSFEGALLAFATVASFRSQRDAWLMAAAAAAILPRAIPAVRSAAETTSWKAVRLGLLMAVAFTWLSFKIVVMNNTVLEAKLAQFMPVAAVQNIQQNHYAGPLFNDFNWGGYLIWNLRMPVSMDGRQNVYGDQRMDRSLDTWSGKPDWASDPNLATAGIVIGPTESALVQLLRTDSRFHLAYEDKKAAVFTRR